MQNISKERVLLNHGSGGRLSRELIDSIFVKHFSNSILNQRTDSAVLEIQGTIIAFTTDSYVVNPPFFPGGDIGKLAVCGTVNDLAVSGAIPQALSAGFIIEEGFDMAKLDVIAKSMATWASQAAVSIVTGDTKVVNRGMLDGIFINTAGIGILHKQDAAIGAGSRMQAGDVVIINGSIGDHAAAIAVTRNNLSMEIVSDCAPLNGLIAQLVTIVGPSISFMRDATRGGLGTVLCEIAEQRNLGIELDETVLPVRPQVQGLCDMYGFDPLFMANEGKLVFIVRPENSSKALSLMREHTYGKGAAIIGRITDSHPGYVTLNTSIGGSRVITMPAGDQLPRIC